MRLAAFHWNSPATNEFSLVFVFLVAPLDARQVKLYLVWVVFGAPYTIAAACCYINCIQSECNDASRSLKSTRIAIEHLLWKLFVADPVANLLNSVSPSNGPQWKPFHLTVYQLVFSHSLSNLLPSLDNQYILLSFIDPSYLAITFDPH